MGLHMQELFFGQPRKFGTWCAGDIAEQVNRFAGKIRIGYLYKRPDPQ